MNYAFPLSATVKRFNFNTSVFDNVYEGIGCDVQYMARSNNQFFPIRIDVYFSLKVVSFDEKYDIRSGDRVQVTNFKSPTSTRITQEFVVKEVEDLSSGGTLSYVQTKSAHNTLLDSSMVESVSRITKSKSQNYNTILEESYGPDIETTEEFSVNVVQGLVFSQHSRESQYAIFEGIEYGAIIDLTDPRVLSTPIKISDIFEYRGEKYCVKYLYEMPNPIKVGLLGLSSLNNESR